jgi:transposase-like protein
MLMTGRRLNEADKQEIVELYRQPGETALTIAERYGVSNSTVGRVLKNAMSPQEYDALVLQKRSRTEMPVQGNLLDSIEPVLEKKPPIVLASQRRALSSVGSTSELDREETAVVTSVDPEPLGRSVGKPVVKSFEKPISKSLDHPVNASLAPAIAAGETLPFAAPPEIAALMEGEEFEDEDDELDDLDDLDEDDLDEEEDPEEEGLAALPSLDMRSLVKILPLAEAAIPHVCYLVVDRSAELVVRPLQEFGDLGQVPAGDIQAMTLPVFDNHRIAKRFSNARTQRVIKVPDSRIFEKTALHLRAKGITRLLVDGQIYAI